MDERDNRIEIANPSDRLSTSNIELNRLNSVQLIDKQNVNGTSCEKSCINNSSRTRTDININAVASHIKEKLHLSSTSGLLNGYNCHAECHLNLNGLEGCEDTSGDEEQLQDKFVPRICETDEPLILQQSDDACETNENCCHEQYEPQKPDALCENISSECQPSESARHTNETLNESDITKFDTKRQSSQYCTICENRESKARDISSAVENHYKCICKKASTTSNCAAVKEEQLPNESDCSCDGRIDEKGVGECSAVISCEGPIKYVGYESENQMPDIMRLIQKDLSEPYSIYTYRYFIHNWPKLCFLAMDGERCVGAIVCKLDMHKKHSKRGYIAMLAVDENYRKKKIGSNLVLKAIQAMIRDEADEVVLETEITNKPALRLYENLGFVRDKRLFRYYLNGVDALRLKLWLR